MRALAAILLGLMPGAATASQMFDHVVATSHRGLFSGHHIVYDAVVEPFDIADDGRRPIARIVATSYLRRAVDGATRPVIFAFNGGPLVSSAALHMGLLGPKRLAFPVDPAMPLDHVPVVHNPSAPLDAADVVLFDPPGTGFSRTATGVDPASLHSVDADAALFARFVAAWTARHGRAKSRRYVVAESYGTIRAARALVDLRAEGLPLSGLMLIGQALDVVDFFQRTGNAQGFAIGLPTLAAIGWGNGRVVHPGGLAGLLTEAEDYARGDYLRLLFLGDRATLTERAAAASRLERLTGLPAAEFLNRDLMVSKQAFRRLLIPGVELDVLDARYRHPRGAPEAGGPALVLDAAARTYFRDDLGTGASGAYDVANPVGGERSAGWEWSGNRGPWGDWPYVGYVRDAFAADPTFRVWMVHGYYDPQTTPWAAAFMASHSGWPADRVIQRAYPGGHMLYTIADSLERVEADIHAMVAPAS